MRAVPVLRHSEWDGLLVGLSIAQGAALVAAPSVPLIALGLWWNANTVAHHFIHAPFFRSSTANSAYSAYLSLVLGIPQRLWRARHLAHHADEAAARRATIVAHRWRWTRAMSAETGLVVALWLVLAVISPRAFLGTYLPGWAIGLTLCLLQGHFEHARGTTSHYGRLYNLAFFNDGYHVEHHRRPRTHWTRLPAIGRLDRADSRWPAVLRWAEYVTPRHHLLDILEAVVLRSARLQAFVLRVHARALRTALGTTSGIRRITIVGGGLFPRSAMILRALFPDAAITVVDADRAHLERARGMLAPDIRLEHATYPAFTGAEPDVIVIPLAFIGDRRGIYDAPPARIVLVHDWLWHPRGQTVRISRLLLKRVNVVRRQAA
jgi:fatty acid desaturase